MAGWWSTTARRGAVRRRALAAVLLAGSAVAAACGDDGDDASTASSTGPVTSESTVTSTTSPFAGSPTSVDEAWQAMDGLFAPSVLQAPTVGLDPFAIRGDPTDLFEEVDLERLMSDVRALSDRRSDDDPQGLAATAALVEDGFLDAGYRVERFPTDAGDTSTSTTPDEESEGEESEGEESEGEESEGEEPEGEGTTTTGRGGGDDEPAESEDEEPSALSVTVVGEDCPEREILVVAPYDAPAGSPGARAASATAAMLEIARLLAENPQPMSVRFLAVPFGADDPTSERMAEVVEGLELEPSAVFVLEGLGVAAPDADDDNLTGLPPAYLLFVGTQDDQYLARTTSLSTAHFLPQFWAFAAVAELAVFPEFDDRFTSSWWSEDTQALLVTDVAERADERVGTEDDAPSIIDRDFLANGVRAVVAAIAGAGTIDSDADRIADACQRDW
jgi:hypothetical protein